MCISMETILTYISSHFFEALIIFLIVLLFFREQLMLVLNQYLKPRIADIPRPSVPDPRLEALQSTMDSLKLHFNDDTTRILTDIQIEQREFRETQVKQCTKLDEISDSLRDIVRNGVRIRK